MNTETCPSCGAVTPVSGVGATHRYLLSSPGCWAAYGELLAREYGDMLYMSAHALTVDAYAAQHPGEKGPQTISSINVHLASLLAYFEQGVPLAELATLKQRLVQRKHRFEWLDPPDQLGEVTITDVLAATDAQSHVTLVKDWARAAFEAWGAYHGTIRSLLAEAALAS
ncbi:MAG: DUF5946 family protein [Pseudomonadota bacterium]